MPLVVGTALAADVAPLAGPDIRRAVSAAERRVALLPDCGCVLPLLQRSPLDRMVLSRRLAALLRHLRRRAAPQLRLCERQLLAGHRD